MASYYFHGQNNRKNILEFFFLMRMFPSIPEKVALRVQASIPANCIPSAFQSTDFLSFLHEPGILPFPKSLRIGMLCHEKIFEQ